MEKIESGKVVTIIYDLYAIDDNGNQKLMHQIDPENPETIIFGITPGVVVPLEKALEGKETGYEFNVVANPNEAFGLRNPELVMDLDKEYFEIDGKFDDKRVKVGHIVPMLLSNGAMVHGKVLEITPNMVKMDFNHPLADKIVRFKGSVIDVRQATDEELHIAAGGGCHGCHGGCGSDGCGSGGCDTDSCGCGHDSCNCESEGGGCGCQNK